MTQQAKLLDQLLESDSFKRVFNKFKALKNKPYWGNHFYFTSDLKLLDIFNNEILPENENIWYRNRWAFFEVMT